MRNNLIVFINGKKKEIKGKQAFMNLSDYLRDELGDKGTKVVCEEGDCGACTVIVGRPELCGVTADKNSRFQYRIVNSCIQTMLQLDRCHIISVEGLTPNQSSMIHDGFKLNEVQQKMTENHGTQCGFCTPGFVVGLTDLAQKNFGEKLNDQQIKDALTGNLCRCTGYDPIIEAGKLTQTNKVKSFIQLYPEKKIYNEITKIEAQISINAKTISGEKDFFASDKLEEILIYYNQYQNSQILSGGSDLGVLTNKGRINPTKIISLQNLGQLRTIKETDDYYSIGALCTWGELENFTQKHYPEFKKIIDVFASPQIKNVATLAGNIINASPISDSIPFLKVANCKLELTSTDGVRLININDFYLGYKKLDLKANEIVSSIHLPKVTKNQKFKLYKVSKRKDLDISIFTGAFFLDFKNEKTLELDDIRIAYGGVGPVVIRLQRTENFLRGKKLSLNNVSEAKKIAIGEITPISDVRASSNYRFLLAQNILEKLFYELSTPKKKIKI